MAVKEEEFCGMLAIIRRTVMSGLTLSGEKAPASDSKLSSEPSSYTRFEHTVSAKDLLPTHSTSIRCSYF